MFCSSRSCRLVAWRREYALCSGMKRRLQKTCRTFFGDCTGRVPRLRQPRYTSGIAVCVRERP